MLKSFEQQRILLISTGMSRFAARILLNVLIVIAFSHSKPVFALSLPRSVNLAVPFTSQAPYTNWDRTHEEACEEAAILMVHWYWEGKNAQLKMQNGKGKAEAERAILDLVRFQKKKYGFFESTPAQQTAQLIKDRWGHTNVDVIADPTLMQIKKELAAGNPVIIPAAGRSLGNPNFKRPGPLYHMLVIKGYTKDGWLITNDAGTRRGAGYRYKSSVLMNAIHDWNGGRVKSGRKVMIVVRK